MLDLPTGSGMDPLRQRRDTTHSSPVNINNILHLLGGQILLADSAGVVEGKILTGGNSSGFHNGNLIDTGSKSLSNQGEIILHAFREHSLFQPYTGKNVSYSGDQQRMQTNRFQAGGIQQGQIQTGTQLLLQYHIAQTYTLTNPFETGRWHHIGDGLFLDCGEDGGSLAQYPVRILRLIAVHRGITGPLTQEFGGAGNDPCQLRMVGRNKGCQQLGVQTHTVPFIKSQDSGFRIVRYQNLFFGLQSNV